MSADSVPSAQHLLRRCQRGLRVAAVELVGLGQQHQQAHLAAAHARRDQRQQALVEFGEAQPRVDHQHHAAQAAARYCR